MLLDRPIPKALFYSHVRLEAKRIASVAWSNDHCTRSAIKVANG